ncbi:MAG: peptidoglycan DD-metalloendopeptidase family protein, partial [Alphaproteobacteria bacterium]
MIKRILSVFLVFYSVFLLVAQPAIAFTSLVPSDAKGLPRWDQISFNNLGPVMSGTTGILTDLRVMQLIGYNPSRSYNAPIPVVDVIKVGDLSSFGVGKFSIGALLGGKNPDLTTLANFAALNGISLNDLVTAIPDLKNISIAGSKFFSSLVRDFNGVSADIDKVLGPMKGDIDKFIKDNPWVKDIPLNQIIQGDWKGALDKGLQAGLDAAIKQFPQLANIPITDILGGLQSGNIKQFLINTAIDTVGDLLQNNPVLADLPIGLLTDIQNFSFTDIPGLVTTVIDKIPGLKDQLIVDVPGLGDASLSDLLAIINSATATVDFPDQGASTAKRAISGGGYNFVPTPCVGPCENFEVNNVKSLIPADLINGTTWVTKDQEVPGGKGPLGEMFGGKEPVHVRPWGDRPNISLAALDVRDGKGEVDLGFYLRFCTDIPFYGKSCTPYSIGPIPFSTVNENDTVLIATLAPPPIDGGGGGGVGPPGGCDQDGGGGPGPTPIDPGSPLASQNLKRYLDRIAAGESSGGTNLGPNYLGAYGKYQFIPTTRATILRVYGYDAWDPKQWDQAALALIKDYGGQGLLDQIAAGNFNYADRVLGRNQFTSLPGGAEQNPIWNNSANLAKYGPVKSGEGGGGIVSGPPQGGGCGKPLPCKEGTTCVLINPNPKGVIPGPGGMYGAPRPGGRIHAGVDLASGTSGQPLLAPADGVVTEHVPVGGKCGGIVTIDHPEFGLESRQLHMQKTFVSLGQKVIRGSTIGIEGMETPELCFTTGIHDHYELYSGGSAIDPTRVQ